MKEIQIIMGKKFQKEMKKYSKKYKTLEDDLKILTQTLCTIPKGNKSKHWNILKQDGEKYIFKMRMMCRSLKGSSFRVIYYFDGKKVDLILIELYFKGKKEREDKKRIEDFWKLKIQR
jgi:hypothetical protein